MHGSMLARVFPVGGRDAAVRLFQIHIVDIEIEFLLLHCLTVDYNKALPCKHEVAASL